MPKAIPLTRGKIAIVDDEDYEYLSQWDWCYGGSGYAARWRRIDGKKRLVYMHTVINQTPEGGITDHINRNKLDNRRENLRTVSHSVNNSNINIRQANVSGMSNVWWDKSRRKWRVYTGKKEGKNKFIGAYFCLERAKREAILYGL